MAYSTTTIDVIGRFVDNISGAAKPATRAIDELGEEAEEAGKKLEDVGKKRPRPKVDPDTGEADRKLNATDRLLKKLERSKVKMVIDAIDNASAKFRKLEDTAKSIVGKTWTTVVKIKDLATAPLRAIHNALFNIKTLIGVITAGFAAQKFVAAPIALADQYSSAKIGFSTLLGDKRGQQMMNDLDKFAKETPFNTSQVIAQSQKMIAMGWDAEQIITDMKTIGDAAAATGKGDEGLGRIVLALSQIKSKGKLSTEELNQLAEAGISAKRYIAEGLGYGSGDEGLMKMTKDLEKGAIGAEAGINAIIEGMKEYNGMMNKTANETMSGIASQIGDTFEINIFRRWGQGLQDGAKKGFGSVLELLDKSEAGLKRVGDLLFDLGSNLSNWFANRMKGAVEIATALTETDEFKNAGLGGKIKILWDGIVADPIREWWNGGGQQKAATTMGKIGAWLGKTISNLLIGALKGTDALNGKGGGVGEKAGSGIAESFVRGFLENFDGGAITDAFAGAVKNVWNALPGWAKVVIGGIGVSKATQGLSGLIGVGRTVAGGVKGVGTAGASLLGTTGNAIASGSGFLGMLASLGYNRKLGKGWQDKAFTDPTFAAKAMGMSGKSAALAGILPALGIAGGVAGAGIGISGLLDIRRGEKENNAALKNAGAWKLGGAAGGAALGAGIGSIIPGVGTLIGAGIGAGVGGAVGWWQSNKIKKAELEKKNLAELETMAESESELAQKAAEEIIRRNKLVAESAKQQFGTVAASLEEIQALAAAVTIGDKAKEMDAFAQAAEEAKNRVAVLENATEQLNKWNWKASISFAAGHEMSAEQKQGYLDAVENFIKSAEATIESKHYEVTAAVKMLLKPEDENGQAILGQTDAFYSGLQEKLNGLSKELTSTVTLALSDGKIDPESEAKVIADLQSQIAEITNKITKAQNEAELETLKIKFSSGQLDYESFTKLQQELQTQVESATDNYDTALTTSITSLKLQLDEGAINQETYDEQIKALTEGYNANIGEIKASAESIQLEILGGAYEDILGEESKTKLNTALAQSINEGMDPIDWTLEDAQRFLGVETLDEQTALALGQMLSSMADKEEIAAAATSAGDSIAEKLKPSEAAMGKMGTEIQTGVNNEIQNKITAHEFSADVHIKANPIITGLPAGVSLNTFGSEARGGIIYPAGSTVKSYGTGGMVRGGGRLIRVAEEGTPEMIIPLGSQRRERGMKLWERAGQMLGIPGFANGGLVGGQDEGLRFRGGDTMESGIGGGQTVQVEVGGITVEIHVDGGETGNIAEAIRAQANEIAETVAGIMADAFTAQFENTPARGGAI